MRRVVLDTETTGLEVSQGHRVIEIAAVELLDRRPTGRHFHRYLNPEREIDPGAVQVHGLTADFLADKPRFADVAEELLGFLDGGEVLIHNAAFDVGFLDKELERVGKPPLARIVANVIDTLAMAKEMFPGKRNSLDALCDRLGVDNSGRTLHGALLDAEAPDDFITALVLSVRSLVPVDELVAEVERRNRLKLLTPILEQLIGEGRIKPCIDKVLPLDEAAEGLRLIQDREVFGKVVVTP